MEVPGAPVAADALIAAFFTFGLTLPTQPPARGSGTVLCARTWLGAAYTVAGVFLVCPAGRPKGPGRLCAPGSYSFLSAVS